jgi:hypothetical protein
MTYELNDSVVVRAAREADERALWRLAALDSRAAPTGPTLVAEAGGKLVAALSVKTGRAVADPFRRTAGAVALLKLRASQLHVTA